MSGFSDVSTQQRASCLSSLGVKLDVRDLPALILKSCRFFCVLDGFVACHGVLSREMLVVGDVDVNIGDIDGDRGTSPGIAWGTQMHMHFALTWQAKCLQICRHLAHGLANPS